MNAAFKVIGIFVGVILIFALGFAAFMEFGLVPSDRVVTHAQMPERHLDALRAEDILQEGEKVELFYADGLFSVTSGGSILTDRRLLAYESGDDDETYVYQIPVDEIASIELVQSGDMLNFQVYEVTSTNGEDWVQLWLPHEFGDAERFAEAIRARIVSDGSVDAQDD